MNAAIDVLAVMDRAAKAIDEKWAIYEGAGELLEARATVAELVEVVKRVEANVSANLGSLPAIAETWSHDLRAALARVGGAP